MLFVLPGLLVLSVIAAVIILRRAGGGKFPWIQFYTKGKESGFNFKELNLLRRVAVENHLANPTSLFWSVKQLDRSIRGVVVRLRAEGKETDETSIQFVSKLYEFRKKVEFSLPKHRLGLKSTRKLATSQRITITLPGIGTYHSQIVENLRRYMAISFPEGPTLPDDFVWKSRKINVYFWRADDAGYVFESRVLEDFRDRDYPILHITHSDSMIRSQKRRSIRIEVNMPARLFPLQSAGAANDVVEESSGLRGRLMDVSEDGCAVMVGGRAKVGMVLKVQFSLTNEPLAMPGVVKGVNFDEKKNRSLLHLQALPIRLGTRNKILSYVYNIFGERDEKAKQTIRR
ncbi:MAG: PilZ domain-containing protein [Spirochaetales bacterium]|nr:PilZ domain-containing protein [Spirochaetales bacterium]